MLSVLSLKATELWTYCARTMEDHKTQNMTLPRDCHACTKTSRRVWGGFVREKEPVARVCGVDLETGLGKGGVVCAREGAGRIVREKVCLVMERRAGVCPKKGEVSFE